MKDRHGNTIIGDNMMHGIEISRHRLRDMLNEYKPRFQKKLIQSPAFLGKGSFGKVYKVSFVDKKQEFALKVLPSDNYPEDIWRERDLLIFLKHKRVINLVGAFHATGSMYFVLELCFCE